MNNCDCTFYTLNADNMIIKQAYNEEDYLRILTEANTYCLFLIEGVFNGGYYPIGESEIPKTIILVENGHFAGCHFGKFGSVLVSDGEAERFVGTSADRDDILPKSFLRNCYVWAFLRRK